MKKIYIISIISFVTICLIGVGFLLLGNNKSEKSNEKLYQMSVFNEGLVLVKEGDYYKYLDKSGKVAIQNNFIYATTFINKRAIVGLIINNEIQYTVINKKGENAINNQFFRQLRYDEDASAYIFRVNDKYGMMDKEGNVFVEPIYVTIGPFNEGVSTVVNDVYTYSIIDKSGKLITKELYDTVSNFSNGMAVVSKNNKFGAINSKGELTISMDYSYISNFSERGFAIAKEIDPKTYIKTINIIDKSGCVTYSTTDMMIISNGNYFLEFQSYDELILINEKGDDVVGKNISNFYYYNFYYTCVYTNDQQEYIGVYDANLKLISEVMIKDYISTAFDIANNEVWVVSKVNLGIKFDNGYESFIYECDPTNVYVNEYSCNGYYVVKGNNFYGVINNKGRVVIDVTHGSIKLTSDGYAIVRDQKTGIYNLRDDIIIPQEYDKIEIHSTYK